MSLQRQRTLGGTVTLEGTGVHSGEAATLTFRPADPDTGIRFRRVDLEGRPEIRADVDNVCATDLGTTLGAGEARILTVEHVMAALGALRIDNVVMELSGPEIPIRDGSFQDYVTAIDEASTVEQDADARVLSVRAAISAGGEGAQSYVAVPGKGLRVSATIDFEHEAIGRQYGSFVADESGFRTELACARTFGFRADAEKLRGRGLALGASLENTIVLDEDGVMNDGLRFPDELLRHKVGDVVGDLALLGARLEAHVVAERPSHAGNVALARALRAHASSRATPVVDAARIMQFLPHRYPMLLVDRIIEYHKAERIVGIKNVTINEPFFQGHYPGHPVMPGVLIIEAMAQVGGLLLMEEVQDPEQKVVYFMTMDGVKWRRPVTPGDTIRFELEILQHRRNTCRMRGKGFVEGHLVAEAEFMAKIMDR
jgi:UDP-3-O-[3-hydroxymyristoyl] N-acetylglucosamine deacetylase/3-hydroxyacyl-[acyl-carrier-protein] dehydratase